jgi:hypothetical protein
MVAIALTPVGGLAIVIEFSRFRWGSRVRNSAFEPAAVKAPFIGNRRMGYTQPKSWIFLLA